VPVGHRARRLANRPLDQLFGSKVFKSGRTWIGEGQGQGATAETRSGGDGPTFSIGSSWRMAHGASQGGRAAFDTLARPRRGGRQVVKAAAVVPPYGGFESPRSPLSLPAADRLAAEFSPDRRRSVRFFRSRWRRAWLWGFRFAEQRRVQLPRRAPGEPGLAGSDRRGVASCLDCGDHARLGGQGNASDGS